MAVLTFQIVGPHRRFSDYYDQDPDRVERSAGAVHARSFTHDVLAGGLFLGVETMPLVTYTAAPIQRTALRREQELGVTRINLAVGSEAIANALANDPNLLLRARVMVRRTYAGLPADDMDSYRDMFVGVVTNWGANNGVVEVEVSDRWFDWGGQLNKRVVNKLCQLRFKGARCAYAGAETRCDRTLTRCTELANQARFGGFRYVHDLAFTGLYFV